MPVLHLHADYLPSQHAWVLRDAQGEMLAVDYEGPVIEYEFEDLQDVAEEEAGLYVYEH